MEKNENNPEVEEAGALRAEEEKRKSLGAESSQNFQEYFVNITEDSVAIWEVGRNFLKLFLKFLLENFIKRPFRAD
jgi:hypothetical protein